MARVAERAGSQMGAPGSNLAPKGVRKSLWELPGGLEKGFWNCSDTKVGF